MSAAADGPGRVIGFRWGSAGWALPLGAVAGVWADAPTRALPGAPPAVAGLAALSGRIVVVIEAGRILGLEQTAKNCCLLRLAAPLEDFALRVPADVELTSIRQGNGADSLEPRELEDGTPVALLDPVVLRARILALHQGSP